MPPMMLVVLVDVLFLFLAINKYIYIILFYVFHGVSASHNGLG